jgi:nucleoid-associated protein YgaU
VFALAGVAVIIVAIAMSIWSNRREEAPPAPAQQAASAPSKVAPGAAAGGGQAEKAGAANAPAAATAPNASSPSESAAANPAEQAAAPTAESAPSFDVVRIARDGRAVMAGRAAPGATVIITDGDKEVGRVKANERGEWVFTLDKPLPPGSAELTLHANNPNGESKAGDAPVVLVVPEHGTEKTASASGTAAAAGSNEALAIKVRPGGAVQLLQVPTSSAGSGGVSVEVVNFDEKGHLSVAGRAPPQATVQVYLDNAPIGRTTSDAKGAWSITADHPLSEGSHAVRADQVAADGKVIARAEITFNSGAGGPSSGQVTVAFGNSLWRIARRAYGTGFDYVVIYKANKEQIRNPDLIYPGQIFKLPSKG